MQYLIANKKVTLHGLGTFYLSPDAVIQENDKEPLIPEGALSFSANSRAQTDEELIAYIMQQTKKIRPLATSDLDSFLHLGIQFLNLGKPFIFDGLGFLLKNSSEEVSFTPSYASLPKMDLPAAETREKSREEISFASLPKKKNLWKTLVPVALIAVFLTGSALYYFFGRSQEKAEQTREIALPEKVKSPDKDKPSPVTVDIPSENPVVVPAPAALDAAKFRVVLKQYYDSAKATRFFNLIKNSHPDLVMYAYDSVSYNVAVDFNLPLADTQRVRDSLARLVGLRAWLDLSSR